MPGANPLGKISGSIRRGLPYAAVLGGVALALWVMTVPSLAVGSTFLLLIAAVTVSAFLGGVGPAVLAACAAVLGYVYVLLPRHGPQPGDAARLLLFIAVAALITILSASARRATTRARDKKRWLEVTISSIGDAVVETDAGGLILLLNAVAEDLTGWRSAEAVGTQLTEVFKTIDEDTRVALESPVESVLQNKAGAGRASRTVLINRTGREIPIDHSSAPIRDDDGTILGVILVFRDISERRRSENELFESEERLRLAQEASRMGAWDWNISTGKLNWSGDIETLQGFPPDRFDGSFQSYLHVVHPDDRDRLVETIQQALREKSSFDAEFRVVRPDGGIRWLAGKGQVFLGPEGRAGRMIGIGTDITDRKNAEDALRASEERFSKAFNSSPLPKWIGKSRTGEIVDVNEAFLRSTGYERDEVLGRVPGQFGLWVAPEDAARLAEVIRANVRARDLELKFRRKSGQVRLFLLSFERITLDGEPCFLAVASDITERKQAEDALRESEQRFRLMADHAPVMIWLAGPDKLFTYFNRGWLDFTGRTLDEELGAPWAGGVHPDDVERYRQTYTEAFEARTSFEAEYRMRRADGEYRWIVDVGVPRLTSDGILAGYIGSCLDITERRRAEEEREQLLTQAEAAQRRAAFLAEASAVLSSSLEYDVSLRSVAQLAVAHFGDWCTIVVVEEGSPRRVATAHRDVVFFEQAERLVERYTPSVALGAGGVLKTGNPEFVPTVGREWLQSLSEDPEHLQLLLDLDLCSYMCVPLLARGQILGAMTLVTVGSGYHYTDEDFRLARDLASRAAMAVENVRLLVNAQEANRAKDEFLATVSHELRTPLNSILGWARMLNSGRLDQANAGRAIEIIERNARVQAQLIEDLLDISRIISGKLRLDVRSVDLVSVIEAAVDAVRFGAESKGIRIQRVLDSGVELISGDPDRLQQVVWNLLSNAIKFTPKNGGVQVRLEKGASTAEIIVSDTGMGISPEFLPHVFERFRQLDSSSTRKHGGLGLGLAIVSQLVELHGGGIRVESPGKGKGSTFTVSLPLVWAAPVSEDERPRPRVVAASTAGIVDGPVLEGVRVLVVEDEQDAREVLTIALRQCGAEVMSAGSAAEALEILRGERTPDVLVSDIEMPGEDGYALIRKVRALEEERGGRVPAAALTAYARSEDRMRALSAGFQVHIPKPVEPAELVAVVASLSGRTSLVRARL